MSYVIKTWANRFNGRWVVIREHDGKVMTEGTVKTWSPRGEMWTLAAESGRAESTGSTSPVWRVWA